MKQVEEKGHLCLTMKESSSVFITYKGEMLEIRLQEVRTRKSAKVLFISNRNFEIKRAKVFDPAKV